LFLELGEGDVVFVLVGHVLLGLCGGDDADFSVGA